MIKRLAAISAVFFVLSFNEAYADDARQYVIVLQAARTTHEGMARAVHALLYARELREHGHTAVLLFDGAGTQWINEWVNPASQDRLKAQYEALRRAGVTEVICDFCATAFEARSNLDAGRIPLNSEYQGHASIAKYADEGYEIVVL